MSNDRNALFQALHKLLWPLIRVLLRNGITYGELCGVCKQVYVEVGNSDFVVPGKKQSKSRISVVTGIHRHEVGKLLNQPKTAIGYATRHNRTARIISNWQHDSEFSDNGKANVLALEPEFAALVGCYGGDVTPRSVLDELLRVNVVDLEDSDKIRLLVEVFSPSNSHEDQPHLFGDSASDLLETLDHNLAAKRPTHLQMSVIHNNMPDDVIQDIELTSRDRAMNFLQDLDRFFATQDRDSNPKISGKGRNRAGIGLYYFQFPDPSESETEPEESTSWILAPRLSRHYWPVCY